MCPGITKISATHLLIMFWLFGTIELLKKDTLKCNPVAEVLVPDFCCCIFKDQITQYISQTIEQIILNFVHYCRRNLIMHLQYKIHCIPQHI